MKKREPRNSDASESFELKSESLTGSRRGSAVKTPPGSEITSQKGSSTSSSCKKDPPDCLELQKLLESVSGSKVSSKVFDESSSPPHTVTPPPTPSSTLRTSVTSETTTISQISSAQIPISSSSYVSPPTSVSETLPEESEGEDEDDCEEEEDEIEYEVQVE